MSAKAGHGMAGVRAGISGNPKVKEQAVGCTEAVCGLVKAIEEFPGGGKRKKVAVSLSEDEVVIIATSWVVNVGDLVAIATVGSFCGDYEVKSATVNGVETNGKILDAATLGWTDGNAGTAVVLPSRFSMGDTAPDERPKRIMATPVETKESGPPKKTKLELKAEKEAKKLAKQAADKAAKLAARGEEEEEVELVKPTKAQLKKIQKEVKDRRKAGEDCNTDDELEAQGFLPRN